ncbi:four helix bundle protein [bacterium]|nr:four helix bundle protein [bacterium]
MASSSENYWQFEKLRVWQESMDWTAKIYQLSESFPKSELYGLTSQTRQQAFKINAQLNALMNSLKIKRNGSR